MHQLQNKRTTMQAIMQTKRMMTKAMYMWMKRENTCRLDVWN